MRHDALALLRQRIYQVIGGYENANDADRFCHDPALQIVADQKLGERLGSQPTLSRRENAPSAQLGVSGRCAPVSVHSPLRPSVRQRGELLDIDSTDDPTHGQQQLSFWMRRLS